MNRDAMTTNYKPKPGARRYRKYDKEVTAKAIEKGLPSRKAENMFKIPQSVLERHYKKKDIKRQEGQLALGKQLEKYLVGRLMLCALWGYPIDKFDLRCIVKAHLDRRGI